MEKTEAQKRAQKKYMAKNPRKRIPLDVWPEDYELLKKAADEVGTPPITYIKQAISEKSGLKFSWDKKEEKK